MAGKRHIPLAIVVAAIEYHLGDQIVSTIEDRGVWIRHNFKITLRNGKVVYCKVDQAFPASEKEAYICELLSTNDLRMPRILAADATCTLLPAPFVIQEYVGGQPLGDILNRVDQPEMLRIYRALGRFYRKLHSIHHEYSGWIQGAGEVLPFSPTTHQYNEVIVQIGENAVERKLFVVDTHRRLQSLWSAHLAWLEEHPSTLVTGGALPWTVYMKRNDDWHVTKVMDLSDFLYWDPAWDLASIKYPVFREPLVPEFWQAFISEYGSEPNVKRLQLYRLMQYLDAAMGNYLEPAVPEHERWKAHVWATFEHLLDDVERLC